MSSEQAEAGLVIQGIEGSFVPFFVRDQLLAYTDFAAPNFRIVRIDSVHPGPFHWHDVVPESDRRIQQFAVAGDQVFVTRIDRFSTKIEAFGLDGRRREGIPSPSDGTIDLLNRTTATEKLFYAYTSISRPTAVYCYDARREDVFTWNEANSPGDPSAIAVEETAYTSTDGASVPLFLAARKDLLNSGPLPTFLTGYGGFGSCVTPRFTAFATFLMEQGFLFAVPALRGGSELGEQWHRAGKRGNRQNSFNDFVAAAEWLIREQRSISGRIAIGGGSNAGLLVGAAVTQRPDLFRAAICLGPLLDMARYHLFNFAAGWADEYGSPEDRDDFRFLLAYSPYHHVQDGVSYPAVFLISGDADTRCNPMHARKMAARLQAATGSTHPVLLDYKTAWGHTPVQPHSTKIEALTDRLAFVCHELRVRVQPGRSL
jgi:prolyl oligopeptidase